MEALETELIAKGCFWKQCSKIEPNSINCDFTSRDDKTTIEWLNSLQIFNSAYTLNSMHPQCSFISIVEELKRGVEFMILPENLCKYCTLMFHN